MRAALRATLIPLALLAGHPAAQTEPPPAAAQPITGAATTEATVQ